MTTEFEFFEGTTTVDSTEPRVTVRKSGQLVLNQAAVELLGEGVTHVQIGYNAKTRAVGLRPSQEKGRGVLKLRSQPNGRAQLVDGKRFFAHHGLVLSKAQRLEVAEFGGGIAGFRLPTQGADADSKKSRSTRRTTDGA